MPSRQPSTDSRGVAVAHWPDPHAHASEHERLSLLEFGRRLAALRGDEFRGAYEPTSRYPGHVYFVPSCTLHVEQAATLGIHGPDDLFGGVVPHAFVATKAISHPLLSPQAAALPGWNPEFAARAGDALLTGFTVFDEEDAREAGRRLLATGPLRIKPVRATGGHGQSVARNAAELEAVLGGMDCDEIVSHGLVLEENLSEVRTFSVGQIRVADLGASYFGVQRLTRNRHGEEVFGGSELNVVRGGFDELLALNPAAEIGHAIDQARHYHAAVQACFGGFFASRINYDVAVGRDAAGRARSGVLEQSWRVGGATGPEVAALEVFRREPGRHQVRAAGFEVYGDAAAPPAHAIVHYSGTDPHVGRLAKYTVIEPDVHAR